MTYFLLGAGLALLACLLISRMMAARTRIVRTERIVHIIERGSEGFNQAARGR